MSFGGSKEGIGQIPCKHDGFPYQKFEQILMCQAAAEGTACKEFTALHTRRLRVRGGYGCEGVTGAWVLRVRGGYGCESVTGERGLRVRGSYGCEGISCCDVKKGRWKSSWFGMSVL